jgi:hypothetical protein
LVRIMVEATTEEQATSFATSLAEVLISRHGGAIEGAH